jgi:hypothetical protein
MGRAQQKQTLLEAHAAPDLSVVPPEATPARVEKRADAPQKTRAAAPPQATTDNPWRHLHPARVWPD